MTIGTIGLRVHQLPARLDDEVALRPVERAGGPVDVGACDRLRHLIDADLARRELHRVDVDADGVLLRAEDVHLRHAADHREPLREHLSRRTGRSARAAASASSA